MNGIFVNILRSVQNMLIIVTSVPPDPSEHPTFDSTETKFDSNEYTFDNEKT